MDIKKDTPIGTQFKTSTKVYILNGHLTFQKEARNSYWKNTVQCSLNWITEYRRKKIDPYLLPAQNSTPN